MSFEYSQEVIDDYEELFETDEECDVIIYAGENDNFKEIRAHSLVLRTRSQYFQVGLSMKWAEKKDGKFIFKKPNISSQIFKIILRFLYCGKIDLTNLQGPNVLQLLMAVDELNVQTLIPCIQHNLINHHDEFLQKSSIEILDIIYQHESFTDLWNFYLEKICEEPKILFESENFINLNAPLLELLLKRDDLNLDEIKVWENLIKWGLAKEKSLNKDVSKWNQEEFNVFKRILHDFIPFISFYEIPSEDYFKKVKPYEEILPKELREDILKFHNGHKPTFNKLSPRYYVDYHVDSKIINRNYIVLFANWINRKEENSRYIKSTIYEFNLIFRGSRDGFDYESFHNNCDKKGPNIVVIKIKDSNQIIGGYNPLDWGNHGHNRTSDSFIFSFIDGKSLKTGKMGRVIDAQYAVWGSYGSYTAGPLFGVNLNGSSDLMLVNGSWSSVTNSYPNINIPNTFEIDDYEVFQVKVKPTMRLEDLPDLPLPIRRRSIKRKSFNLKEKLSDLFTGAKRVP